MKYKFKKDLYPKIALLKAAYQFTDNAYVHLDADESYYYVAIEPKNVCQPVSEEAFKNEMLAQAVRHEIYLQTKDIRELMLARAMATTVLTDSSVLNEETPSEQFEEDEIIKDWFADND